MKDYRIDEVMALAASHRLRGSNHDDIFLGDTLRDVYFGRGGNDDIVGNQGNDFLNGGGGGDAIYGGAGEDRIIGGPGNDKLSGDYDSDLITGGGGADMFIFRAWGPVGGASNLDIITDFDPRGRNGDFVFMNIMSDYGVSTFAQLKAGMFQDGDDVVMNFTTDVLVLQDVRINQLHRDDFQLLIT